VSQEKTEIRHSDGRVHFSDLKHMAKSPAHYKHACLHPKEPTQAMLIGAAADKMVFGFGKAILYHGRRAGKEWEAFQREYDGPNVTICIESEWAQAKGAASSVLVDPVAYPLLFRPARVVQRCLSWDAYGLPFQAGIPGVRGGVDLIAGDTLCDLKITNDTEPGNLMRHAWSMLWPQQLACYVDGARKNGINVLDAALICVESSPPHVVTVLTFGEEDFEQGRKSLTMWTDRLRACEAAGEWPGYVQAPVPFEAPAWAQAE
jgi:hypothetical protein